MRPTKQEAETKEEKDDISDSGEGKGEEMFGSHQIKTKNFDRIGSSIYEYTYFSRAEAENDDKHTDIEILRFYYVTDTTEAKQLTF